MFRTLKNTTLVGLIFLLCAPYSANAQHIRHVNNTNQRIRKLEREVRSLQYCIKKLKQQHRRSCDSNQRFGHPNHQSWPTCHQDSCKPRNHVHYVRHYFPYVYEVITHNSPKSTAHNNLCIKGMLCFSLLANLDLIYSDRYGEFPGSIYGVGVRPMFGSYNQEILGGINNIDLFVDGAVNDWLTLHLDFAYLNAQRKVNTYALQQRDWTNAYRNPASLKVNEAYLLFANPAITPFYLQIGRIYAPFGYYEPYQTVTTLTTLLSQMRTGGVVLGVALKNGFYASIYWVNAQQSTESLNGFETLVFGPNKDRNYGATVGYNGCVNDRFAYHLNADYIADIRDADYIAGVFNYYNTDLKDADALKFLTGNQYIELCRAAGMALHADAEYCNVGLSADYVKALSGLNPNSTVKHSKISAYNITGYVKFSTFTCPSKFSASYQCADDADITNTFRAPIQQAPVFLPLKVGNILPEYRIELQYQVNIFHNVFAYLNWTHDQDFDVNPAGGVPCRSSNFVLIRLGAQY